MTKTTSWGNVADWYADLIGKGEGTYQSDVILPNLLRRMAIEKGDNVLDLACGPGYFSLEFAQLGASVVGADISDELIEIARKNATAVKTKTKPIFYTSPAHKLPFLQNASIDKIVTVLAIQNIGNVKDVLAECKRVMKPGGSMCIVLNHPAFRVPKASEWGWDEARKAQYRRVDAYLSEFTTEIEMHPGKQPGVKTVSFHRPLQYYAKMLTKGGFCITGFEEWVSNKTSDSGPRAAAENKARAEIPLFLFIEAKRVV